MIVFPLTWRWRVCGSGESRDLGSPRLAATGLRLGTEAHYLRRFKGSHLPTLRSEPNVNLDKRKMAPRASLCCRIALWTPLHALLWYTVGQLRGNISFYHSFLHGWMSAHCYGAQWRVVVCACLFVKLYFSMLFFFFIIAIRKTEQIQRPG